MVLVYQNGYTAFFISSLIIGICVVAGATFLPNLFDLPLYFTTVAFCFACVLAIAFAHGTNAVIAGVLLYTLLFAAVRMYTQYETGLYLVEFAIFGSMLVFAIMAWYFVRTALYYGSMLLFAVLKALLVLLLSCILLGLVVLAFNYAASGSSDGVSPITDSPKEKVESMLNFVMAFGFVNFIASLIGALVAVYYGDDRDD